MGFEPRTQKESNDITELIYSSFGVKMQFPINQTTWFDCWNELNIISSTTYLQQLDDQCTKLLFLGISWEFFDGTKKREYNTDNCILTYSN